MLEENCPMASRCACFIAGECVGKDECDGFFRRKNLFKRALLQEADMRPLPRLKTMVNTDAYRGLAALCDNVEKFVDSGSSLYIQDSFGDKGDIWALKFMQEYLYLGKSLTASPEECPGLYINIPYYLTEARNDIDKSSERLQYIKDMLPKAKLVVLEEFGYRISTSFERDNLLWLLNTRLNKTTIFVSEINPSGLSNLLGKAVTRKVMGAVGDNVFELKDESRGEQK